MSNATQKLLNIRAGLNAKFFERDKEIDAILIAMLARQHILLIGSPGTAKSALASEMSNIVQGLNYFQWLLTRFSTPEELFGPLSMKDFEQGIYKRNTTKKLPEAHLAFLDEIFKSNSAILNSLLTLINERIFYNNGGIINSPLITIVGSSNEYPEEGEGLEALFDRFLLRFEVQYITDNQNFISMLKGNGQYKQIPSITLEELGQLQFLCDMVSIPDDVYQRLTEIRRVLKDEGIHPSDRRFKQSLSVLKAKAFLEQRQFVEVNDIVVLENSLWEDPAQKQVTSDIIRDHAQDPVIRKLEQLRAEAAEIHLKISHLSANGTAPNTDEQLEATGKLKQIYNHVEQLSQNNPAKAAAILPIKQQIEAIQQDVINNVLGNI